RLREEVDPRGEWIRTRREVPMRRLLCGVLPACLALACVRGADEKAEETGKRVTELSAALKSKDVAARKSAAKALADLGGESRPAVGALGDAMLDEDLQVRLDAARALIGVGRPAVPALLAVLKERDRNARKLAAQALGEIGPAARSAIPQLANLV